MTGKYMRRTRILVFSILLTAGMSACSFQGETEAVKGSSEVVKMAPGKVLEIVDKHEFRSVIASTPELLLVDFYADWCDPCRLLAPVLEEIAKENPKRARIYRIDVEENKDLAKSLGMRGIPFVLFFKDHQVIHQRVGLYPKETYLADIRRFS
jgi:thioredoxin 1